MGRRGRGRPGGGAGAQCAYPVLAAAPRRLSALASRYAVALRRTAGGPSRLLQYMSCAHRAEALARATCASRVRLRFARTTFHACTRAALVCAPHAVRWVCPCVCVHSAAGDSLRDPLACARALCGTCAVRLCAGCSCCVCLCCTIPRCGRVELAYLCTGAIDLMVQTQASLERRRPGVGSIVSRLTHRALPIAFSKALRDRRRSR